MLSRPQLGVCTWIFGSVPLTSIAPTISEFNYDGVALWTEHEGTTAVTSKQILAEYNLSVFAITPPNVDLAHPEAKVRQAALDRYQHTLDFASEFAEPLVVVRGKKGRVRPLANHTRERDWLVTAVQQLADEAGTRDLKIVVEVVNRYESHLVNTAAAGVTFLADVSRDNVGVLLNAFHMNIEEQDEASAIRQVGEKMWLYHMADSNRQGIGRGHTKLGAQLWALEDIDYQGPIIMEQLNPGVDPILPKHDEDSAALLKTYLQESRSWF